MKFVKIFRVLVTLAILALFVYTSVLNAQVKFEQDVEYYFNEDGKLSASFVLIDETEVNYDIEWFSRYGRDVKIIEEPNSINYQTDIIYIHKDLVYTFSQKLGSKEWMLFVAYLGRETCGGKDFIPMGSDKPKKVVNKIFDIYISRN